MAFVRVGFGSVAGGVLARVPCTFGGRPVALSYVGDSGAAFALVPDGLGGCGLAGVTAGLGMGVLVGVRGAGASDTLPSGPILLVNSPDICVGVVRDNSDAGSIVVA